MGNSELREKSFPEFDGAIGDTLIHEDDFDIPIGSLRLPRYLFRKTALFQLMMSTETISNSLGGRFWVFISK